MAKTLMTTALVLTLVAGCGGGGGSSDTAAGQRPAQDGAENITSGESAKGSDETPRQEGTAETVSSPTESDQQPDDQMRIRDRSGTLLELYATRIADGRFTDPDALPTNGTARFDGVAGWSMGGDAKLSDVSALESAEMMSRLELNVNFRSNAVSGEINEVFDVRSGDSYGGDLSIAGGLQRGTDPKDQAGLRARAQGDLTRKGETLTLDLDMSGDALADGTAVAGRLSGIARDKGRSRTVQGGFIADR